MNIKKYLDCNAKTLINKNVVVTGATGGIGKEFCKELALLNANIILVSRNKNKLNELKEELLHLNSHTNIKILICDFLNSKSVKELCKQLKNIKINYLIHNAGAYALPKENTEDGYNNIFQINAIIPYYITKELMENIKINKGKVIGVSSISTSLAKVDKLDYQYLNHRPIVLYGNSKRWHHLSLVTLCKINDIDYSIVHPGVSYTNITSNYKTIYHKLIKYPMKLIFNSNIRSSLNIIKGMFINKSYPYWVGPRYFNIWGNPSVKQCKISDDFNFIYTTLNKICDNINNN